MGDSRYTCGFGEGEVHSTRQKFLTDLQKFSASHKQLMSLMKGFSAFLETRRCKDWAQKISSRKYLTLWRPVLPVFPEHRVPHSWSTFRACGRSRVAAAQKSVPAELKWSEMKWKSLSRVQLFMSPWTYGILQARIMERVAFPFSRAFSQPRDWTQVSCIVGGFFTSWATRNSCRGSWQMTTCSWHTWTFSCSMWV